MKNKIQNAMKIIAGFVELIVGKKVNITWGKDAGITPDKRIFIPIPKIGDASEIAALTRVAVHEAGHFDHTEFAAIEDCNSEHLRLFNVLEDPRVEAAQIQKYPGAAIILNRGVEETLEAIRKNLDINDPAGAARCIELLILTLAFNAVAPKKAFAEFTPFITQASAALLEPVHKVAIECAVQELALASSSHDVVTITTKLYQQLTEKPEEDQQEAESDDQSPPDESQGGEDGQQSTEPDGDGEPQATESKFADWKTEFGNGDRCDILSLTLQAYKEKYGAPDDVGVQPDATCDYNTLAILRKVLERSNEGMLESQIESAMVEITELGEAIDMTDASVEDAIWAQLASLEQPQQDEEPPLKLGNFKLEGIQSRLVQVLRKELQSAEKRSTLPTRSGPSVRADRLWRLKKLGDVNMFRGGKNRPGIDAAVTIVLDRSSSMSTQFQVAGQAAIAFSLALERVGNVQTSVTVFPGLRGSLDTIQEFGQCARNCQEKMSYIDANAHCTPTGAAIRQAIQQTVLQKKHKHLLIVITDGMPDSQYDVTEALVTARQHGVEVIGVGIDVDITKSIPNSTWISQADELPRALELLFRQNITRLLSA